MLYNLHELPSKAELDSANNSIFRTKADYNEMNQFHYIYTHILCSSLRYC